MKLGYASSSGPIPVRLRDVCPNGGLIGKVTIVVVRVYPMLYHEKTASGESGKARFLVFNTLIDSDKANNKIASSAMFDGTSADGN